jgi:peroxiredoxin
MLKRLLPAALAGVVALAALAALASRTNAAAEEAKIGAPVKDFTLTDLWTDKPVRLADLKGKPVLGVFISYNCDMTWRYERRIGRLMQDYLPKGVRILAIRSSARDTVDGIKKYAEAKNFTMPLLYDSKNEMADYFRVNVTPTFVLFDSQGILRYEGSCDDNPNEQQAKHQFVRDALDAVLAGRQVAVAENRAFG